MEVRRTLTRVNGLVDEAEHTVKNFIQPLQTLGGAAAGIKTGMKVFETFVQWLKKDPDEK